MFCISLFILVGECCQSRLVNESMSLTGIVHGDCNSLGLGLELIALLFDCIATGGYCNEFQHRVYSSVDMQ